MILFHVLDEAEVRFPFRGMVELEDPEDHRRLALDADSFRKDYLDEIESFRALYRRECSQARIDYVPLDTSMQFDRALTEYLVNRRVAGIDEQMTFVNFALLSGAGLIVIPIILHLIMRRKPKLLEFPALRFIQKRHDTNQRRLRLRHLLLLLLRAGAIALLALALARPSIKFSSRAGQPGGARGGGADLRRRPAHAISSATRKPAWKRPRKSANGSSPNCRRKARSPCSIRARRRGRFDADRGLSRQRIEQAGNRPQPAVAQPDRQRGRCRADRQSDLPTKEIYVFTDLSRASWRADETAKLQDRLHELAGVSLYLIDVGVSEPSNFGPGRPAPFAPESSRPAVPWTSRPRFPAWASKASAIESNSICSRHPDGKLAENQRADQAA